MKDIIFEHREGLQFLEGIPSNSVDLILTDPPYITSRDSGMDKWVGHVEKQNQEGAKNLRAEEEWESFKTDAEWTEWFQSSKIKPENQAKQKLKLKENFLKYGSIYGKKYAVKTNYGDWDKDFTLETLDQFTKQFYRVLRDGGSAIIFFDLWKLTNLKDILEKSKFKQLRFIEWIKTNPQPINSSRNYLTNCREIALMGVKKGKCTFNSKYDNGIYRFPIYGGKDRFHPTQKSLPLFEELIKKHSDPGHIVVDPFAGSATTAVACMNTNRKFMGCELDEEYFHKAQKRIEANEKVE
jgi:site-specific DNA-methyltransferase (adenine-specific)|tara:strand:+ start:2842 stop:3729 length:888 start_codon:yes stop_codon:yes gene_type:complete